jgi:hypothetical protein
LPARFVPPSGFGDPLDGFRPSNPCRFCFAPTALLGFTLRSVPPSQGPWPFPTKSTHRPFGPGVIPPPKRLAGLQSVGPWVSAPARIPYEKHVFSAPPAGCSLGFSPSRASCRRPWFALRQTSPHALVANCALRPIRACASGCHQPTARCFRISARGRVRMQQPF